MMKYQTQTNLIVLIVLFIALYMNWSWPWGLLFIYWALPSYFNGEVFLVGPVTRKQNPLLFWVIIILWISLGTLMVLSDVPLELMKGF